MTSRLDAKERAVAIVNGDGNGRSHRKGGTIRLTRLSEVKPEHVAFRWPGRIPVGKLAVLEGPPGLGKSTLAAAIAAAVSSGRALPGGDVATAADVLIVSYEDGVADTIAPRVLAAGGDPRRVHVVDGVTEGREPERPFTIPDDVEALRSQIERTGARLVIIDPFGAALAGSHDAHRDQDVRRGLAPIAKVAEDTGASILIIRHTRKGANGSAIDAGMGSVGIGGAARVVLSVHRHPEDPDRRVLAVTKCNVAKEAPSLVWRLVPVPEFGCARVEWLGETELRADALLAAQREDSEDESSGDDRTEWLRAILGDGPLAARDVLRLGRQAGYADRSVQRTAKRLRVDVRRQGVGREHLVLWSLPGSTHATPPSTSGVAPVAGVERNGASTPASLFTDATHASPDMLGNVAPVPRQGVLTLPDGSQEFTADRIAELRDRRTRQGIGDMP